VTAEPRPEPRRPPGPLTRKDFLAKLTIADSAVGAAVIGVPFVGFLLAPFFERQPQAWRAVGRVESFQIGTTVKVSFIDASPLPWAGVVARTAAWLRRETQDSFIAFSVNCTHLGCPVRWLPGAALFMCPCHGGVFYEDGAHASGPPPRGLFEYQHKIEGGELKILGGNLPTLAEPT